MADQSALQVAKDIGSLIASVANTLAIVVGGILAWRRWGREVPQAPRGDLSHEVTHYRLSETQRLVHVALTIKNTGKVMLMPVEAYTLIQRVTPLEGEFGEKVRAGDAPVGVTKVEFDWPRIARRDYPLREEELRIDSGETEKLHSEFIVPADVRSVFVYSLACLDQENTELGWDVTSFHELSEQE